jgi:hypothetical protein
MIYPNITTDILFRFNNTTFELFVSKIFMQKINDTSITASSEIVEEESVISKDEWINQAPIIGIYLNSTFIAHHENKNPELKVFYDALKETLSPLTNISKPIYESIKFPNHKPFVFLTIYYKTEENLIFKFIYDGKENIDEVINSINQIVDLLVKYINKTDENLINAIQSSFTQNNSIKYFIYDKDWYVLNPLIEVSKEINKKYLENKDNRVSKPHILMQRDDYSKYIILDSNWVLEFEGLETLLIKPNDVSLYSSISINNLNQAQIFYDKVIIPRLKEYGGSFPTYEKQKEYYNYFELIITSIIFAYTSLEAFANICIPNNYEYITDKSGVKTIYSKTAIEKKFPLREKFKDILSPLLKITNITNEHWWHKFIKLEEIRNEIIHTKETTSEERYSKLLTKEIFELIIVHQEIISFLGNYISQNKQELLAKFPYSFGFDEFLPGFTTKENFDKSKETLRK